MTLRLLSVLLLTLGLIALPGCPDPAPPGGDDDDASGDDDDATDDDDSGGTSDDDDSSTGDDDDATEEPTPEPEEVLVPEGADVGVPGQLAGIRATGGWNSIDWVSNQAEVALVAPGPGGPPPELLAPGLYADTTEVDPAALDFDQILKGAIRPALQGGE